MRVLVAQQTSLAIAGKEIHQQGNNHHAGHRADHNTRNGAIGKTLVGAIIIVVSGRKGHYGLTGTNGGQGSGRICHCQTMQCAVKGTRGDRVVQLRRQLLSRVERFQGHGVGGGDGVSVQSAQGQRDLAGLTHIVLTHGEVKERGVTVGLGGGGSDSKLGDGGGRHVDHTGSDGLDEGAAVERHVGAVRGVRNAVKDLKKEKIRN